MRLCYSPPQPKMRRGRRTTSRAAQLQHRSWSCPGPCQAWLGSGTCYWCGHWLDTHNYAAVRPPLTSHPNGPWLFMYFLLSLGVLQTSLRVPRGVCDERGEGKA